MSVQATVAHIPNTTHKNEKSVKLKLIITVVDGKAPRKPKSKTFLYKGYLK